MKLSSVPALIFLLVILGASPANADGLKADFCLGGVLSRVLGEQQAITSANQPLIVCRPLTGVTCSANIVASECILFFNEIQGPDALVLMNSLSSGGGEGNRANPAPIKLWETPPGETPGLPCNAGVANCKDVKLLVCVNQPQPDCKIVTESQSLQ